MGKWSLITRFRWAMHTGAAGLRCSGSDAIDTLVYLICLAGGTCNERLKKRSSQYTLNTLACHAIYWLPVVDCLFGFACSKNLGPESMITGKPI